MNDRHEFTNSHQTIQQHASSVTRFVTIRLPRRRLPLPPKAGVIGVVTALLIPLLIPVVPLHAQTQSAMNAQARADFQRADADLNKTYQSALAKLPTVESKQKLKEQQRAWIASRDAEAARAAKEADGGSMAPTLRYETMAELTRQRIKQLKTRLTRNDER